VQLKKSANPEKTKNLLRRELDKRFPQMESHVTTAASRIIDIRVHGGALAARYALAEKVRTSVARVPGTLGVAIRERIDAPGVQIEVDRAKAAALGVSAHDVFQQFKAATRSGQKSWIGPSGWRIQIATREEEFLTLDTLRNVPIASGGQKTPVPLRNLATLKSVMTPLEIQHRGLEPVFHVRAEVVDRDRIAVVRNIHKALLELEVRPPKGFRLEVDYRGLGEN
jgi:multidrug efflux pump subunit AcrB